VTELFRIVEASKGKITFSTSVYMLELYQVREGARERELWTRRGGTGIRQPCCSSGLRVGNEGWGVAPMAAAFKMRQLRQELSPVCTGTLQSPCAGCVDHVQHVLTAWTAAGPAACRRPLTFNPHPPQTPRTHP
jgi:hypothetical protein